MLDRVARRSLVDDEVQVSGSCCWWSVPRPGSALVSGGRRCDCLGQYPRQHLPGPDVEPDIPAPDVILRSDGLVQRGNISSGQLLAVGGVDDRIHESDEVQLRGGLEPAQIRGADLHMLLCDPASLFRRSVGVELLVDASSSVFPEVVKVTELLEHLRQHRRERPVVGQQHDNGFALPVWP